MAAEQQKQTIGLKLAPEIAGKFKELQGQAGSAQEFVESLLIAYAERQEETDTSSPVYKEQLKLKQAFAQAERVATAFLELAANDKIQAEKQAQKKITAAQNELYQVKEQLCIKRTKITELEADNVNLKKEIETLTQQIENTKTLKTVFSEKEQIWQEKESALVAQIKELEIEAKKARELKNQTTELKKTITDQEKTIALSSQKTKTDTDLICDLKTDLKAIKKEHKTEIATIKAECQQALDTLKIDHKNAISDLTNKLIATDKTINTERGLRAEDKATTAKEIGKLEQQIITLQLQLEATVTAEKPIKK